MEREHWTESQGPNEAPIIRRHMALLHHTTLPAEVRNRPLFFPPHEVGREGTSCGCWHGTILGLPCQGRAVSELVAFGSEVIAAELAWPIAVL